MPPPVSRGHMIKCIDSGFGDDLYCFQKTTEGDLISLKPVKVMEVAFLEVLYKSQYRRHLFFTELKSEVVI